MYPNLKLQLWRTGIRQNSLAKVLGVDEATVSRIINGFREPNPHTRAKIAALLDSDEKWLFEPAESVQLRSLLRPVANESGADNSAKLTTET